MKNEKLMVSVRVMCPDLKDAAIAINCVREADFPERLLELLRRNPSLEHCACEVVVDFAADSQTSKEQE